MQHAKLAFYLKSIGIDPDGCQIANIPFPNHPRALEAGEVDMAMTFRRSARSRSTRGTPSLFASVRRQFGKQEIGFIVNREAVQEKPDLVQRIVSSHVEAMSLSSATRKAD